MPLFAYHKVISIQLTISTLIYAANDVVGGLLTIPINITTRSGGVIRAAHLADDDNEQAGLKLYLYDALPSTIADQAAFAPTIADLQKQIGRVAIAAGDYVSVGGNAVAHKEAVDIEFTAPEGNVYGYLVCDATPTYTNAADLHLRLLLALNEVFGT